MTQVYSVSFFAITCLILGHWLSDSSAPAVDTASLPSTQPLTAQACRHNLCTCVVHVASRLGLFTVDHLLHHKLLLYPLHLFVPYTLLCWTEMIDHHCVS